MSSAFRLFYGLFIVLRHPAAYSIRRGLLSSEYLARYCFKESFMLAYAGLMKSLHYSLLTRRQL